MGHNGGWRMVVFFQVYAKGRFVPRARSRCRSHTPPQRVRMQEEQKRDSFGWIRKTILKRGRLFLRAVQSPPDASFELRPGAKAKGDRINAG